jgi:hypothetical protein
MPDKWITFFKADLVIHAILTALLMSAIGVVAIAKSILKQQRQTDAPKV